MADLDCCIITFNCGRELIDPDHFAHSIHQSLSADTPPDLLVVALEEIAPLAYSFLGGSYIAPYFARFHDAIDRLVDLLPGSAIRYENVLASNAGLTGMMIFAQPDVARSISRVETGAVRVGDYELGNKGAVAARLGYRGGADEVQMTFVSAHLAPGEQAYKRRNLDWKTIVENLALAPARVKLKESTAATGRPGAAIRLAIEEEEEPLLSSFNHHPRPNKSTGLYSPTSHLFVAGDLNYRTSDLAPEPNDHKAWPTPHLSQDPSVPPSSDQSPFASL